MFKRILDQINEIFKERTFILGLFFLVLMGILIHRLFVLQIIKGEDYLETFTYRIQKDTELESPRGTIYDCNGTPLAYNKLAYSVTIEDSTLLTNNQTKNTMIANLIGFVESTDNTLQYDLPLTLQDDGTVAFSGGDNTILRFKKDVYSTETLSELQLAATAQDVYTYMRGTTLFNLDPSFDAETALKILSVRFDLYMNRYEKYLSVTVASDVNDELVAAVKENAADLPGVEINQDYTRVYADSKYFSNITGYIGSISEEQLAELQEGGNTAYSQNDQIGKTGIESYYESTLKGTKGSQTLYVNSLGSILETAATVDPIPGNDVYLSIDADFQKNAYDMLEERIAGILLLYMTGSSDSGSGSDLFIPIKDFYYALIDNNIISLTHLSGEDADETEQNFFASYNSYQTSIMHTLDSKMTINKKSLDEEYASYISMAYTMLKDAGILQISQLEDGDSTLADWSDGNISFADLINYSITQDVVDVSQLAIDGDYLDTDEIYQAVLTYIKENMPSYEGFEKKVYYYMLKSDYISGQEICLLLYSQGVLEKDDDYDNLLSGSLSPYNFMYNKIYNLEITPDMLALPPCSGSFIITDINTGQVKALVSYPGYDANQINNVTYFSSLINNQSSPFYNRVTQQTMAPGSTFKIISAIAGLEEGIITEDDYITDYVEFTKVEPYAHCWNANGHGTINVVDAIRDSCNYFFYELGYRMGTVNNKFNDSTGLAILRKYATMFGLNETTGIELAESAPQISDESVVRSAIGQGTNNYTAAQLCRYITAVANSGTLYNLSVIDKIADAEGTTIEEKEPVVANTLDISQKTWDLVHRGMYKVCNESSYKEKMGNLGITLAGKSGTAQESETMPNHGLFVGYAPYENPEIAAALIIPNGHGSSNVLDLYADLMCRYFNVQTKSNTDDEDATDTEETTGRHANIPSSVIQSD